jgi:hypothetical protein
VPARHHAGELDLPHAEPRGDDLAGADECPASGRQLAAGSRALTALNKVSTGVDRIVSVQSRDGSLIWMCREFRPVQATLIVVRPV